MIGVFIEKMFKKHFQKEKKIARLFSLENYKIMEFELENRRSFLICYTP